MQTTAWWPDWQQAPVLLRERAAPAEPPRTRTGHDQRRVRREASSVASITVSRASPDDVGFREVFVAVDEQQVAVLRYGDSVTHEVPAGRHRVQAHNTLFWKTHEVVLQPGEHVRFVAVNRAGWGTFGLLLLLGVAPIYLTFVRGGDGDEEEGGRR